MQNRFLLSFGVILLVGLLAIDAQGRPGGGGGRRGGGANFGGARPGNVRGGNVGQQGIQGFRDSGGKLQSIAGGNIANNVKNGNLQNKTSQLKTNFTPANQPFTASWYANHPNAWQYTHPHADAWAVATLAGAAGWLGIAATTGGTTTESESIYTGETTTQEQPAEETPIDAIAPNDPNAGDFLPLGVFALAPKGEKDANALVQLAVDKQGQVRGNYYDVLTGQEQPISGTLDKKTQQATFKAGPGNSVTFETSLANLTQQNGSVTLKFANGQSRQWTLARFDETASQSNAPRPGAPQSN